MSTRIVRIVASLAMPVIVVLISGCTSNQKSDAPPNANQQTRRIVAVSYALQYLTQRIAGEDISVEFPAKSAANPRVWNPSVADVAAMQRADLIVVNGSGAEYAQWLVHTTLPASKICNSCEDLKLRELISVPDHRIIHAHGPEGEHSHAYMVPYAWLDPSIAIKQAKTIKEYLNRIYPESTVTFEANFKSLESDLKQLADLATNVSKETGQEKVVITANPHLKYLTRAVGLKDVHLLWFELPNDTDWDSPEWQKQKKELNARMQDIKTSQILMTQKPPDQIANYLSNNGLEVVLIDCLELQPDLGDYLSGLRKNIAGLAD